MARLTPPLTRVGIVNCTDGVGGAEFYGRELARGLVGGGVTVSTFIAGDRDLLERSLRRHGLDVQRSGRALRMSRPWTVVRNALALRRWVRDLEPQVLYCNLPRAVLLARLAGVLLRVNVVPMFHGPIRRDPLSRASVIGVRRVLTNTAWTAAAVRERLPDVQAEVLYPVLPAAPQDERPAGRRIVMVGRFQEYKGHLDFVELARRLHSGDVEHSFVIVGAVGVRDAAFLERVRAAVTEAGLSDLVEVRQGVGDDELAELLASAAVYVHPAHEEDFGISVIEALAHGCRVAAYATPGPAHILSDPECSVVVPVGDVAGLVEAVQDLAARPTTSSRAAARRLGLAHSFTPDYAARCRAVTSALMPGSGGSDRVKTS